MSTVQAGAQQQLRAGSRVLLPGARRQHRCRAAPFRATAQQQGGLGDSIRKTAQKIQASLPIIGLISRLTTPEGGLADEELAYPEFCRSVYEAAPVGFQVAVAELQDRHGRAAQRRNVLLCLWLAKLGAGLLPDKTIVDAATRLRVSQDIEMEMDRFTQQRDELAKKYTYVDRPRGTPAKQAALAVDALARLCLGAKDGTQLEGRDAELIAAAAAGGFWDVPGFEEEAQRAVAQREQRADAYKA